MSTILPPEIGFAVLTLSSLFIAFFCRTMVLYLGLFQNFSLKLALGIFLWIFISSALVFVAGMLGILQGTALFGLSVILVLLTIRNKTLPHLPLWKNVKSVWCNKTITKPENITRHTSLYSCLFLLSLIIIIRAVIHVWFLAPYVWDVLVYHLPKVVDWIQFQAIVTLPKSEPRAYWPANFELLQAWFIVFPHHDVFIELAGIPYYLLALTSLYSIGRSLRLNTTYTLLICVLYASTPSVLLNSLSCKNDIAIAGLFLFLTAVIMDYVVCPGALLQRAFIFVIAFIFGMGVKPYLMFISPGLMVMIVWAYWKTHKENHLSEHRNSLYLIPLFILTLTMTGFWYVRNYMLFSNPFHPTDFSLFGHLIFGTGHGLGQQGTFKLSSMVIGLNEIFTERIFDIGRFDPDLGMKAGWGWFCFAGGIPTAVVALFLNRSYCVVAISFFLSLASLFGWVNNDIWNMRFTLWFPAIFALGFGCTLSHLRFYKEILIGLSLLCCLLNLIGTLDTNDYNRAAWRRWIQTPWHQRAVNSKQDSRIQEKVPSAETIACFISHVDQIYTLSNPNFSRRIQTLQVDVRTRDFAKAMRDKGLRYLYFPRLRVPPDPEWKVPMLKQIKEGQFLDLGDDLYFYQGFSQKPR